MCVSLSSQAFFLGEWRGEHTSCHAHTGRNESKKPTSSNKLGYSHRPGGAANMVMMNRINRTIAMAKNSPIRPSMPILRYHTPCLRNSGHRGNSTTAMTSTSAPAATVEEAEDE